MLQRIGALIHPSWMALKDQADKQCKADELVKTLLPEALKSHCQVRQFIGGCLKINVDDAVWVALLRYQLPQLRDTLRQYPLFYGLCSIDLVIEPAMHQLVKKKTNRIERELSEATRQLIKNTSEQIHYEPLSQALERLGQKKNYF